MCPVWVHRFAILTAGATLVLIFVGALVTSTGSGLAVPDWPLSFGQVFPPMVGGVLFEHGHRLVAALVGLLTVTLMVPIRFEPSVAVAVIVVVPPPIALTRPVESTVAIAGVAEVQATGGVSLPGGEAVAASWRVPPTDIGVAPLATETTIPVAVMMPSPVRLMT